MTAQRRNRLILGGIAVLAVLLAAAGHLLSHSHFGSKTVSAIFETATGIYPGDQVRVAGVPVGTITSMEAEGTQVRIVMAVDDDVAVPAEAGAIVVAENLVSSRFVQLAPLYTNGPTLQDGAVIPRSRTAVPVEWDEVKTQLNRLAADLGPQADVSTTSVGRFIDSAADALDGNGAKLRQTISELSGAAKIFADGSGDLVGTVQNLQAFVSALRDSSEQIVAFEDRLATLTAAVDGSRGDLDAALTDLSEVIDDVQRFVRDSSDETAEQVQRLANVTQNLVDHRMDLEQVLHVTPTSLANAYNMFDPRTGGASGVFVLNNMSDPVSFVCGMTGALENVTAPESAKLCSQTLGPALRTMNFNYLPFPFSPFLTAAPSPGKLIYTEPKLAPGGDLGPPAAPVPSVSAYTGAPGDPPATLEDLLFPGVPTP
ncbi:MCE family protein [Mycobacterium sp. AMU20-3851]|uniref:MCE family protein n=1 Tax=Mycobacterium sp. AMU20-3851 TaxID=3122055 RepID=UPI003754BFFD